METKRCLVCNSKNVRPDYDNHDTMMNCDTCGSEWNCENEITFNALETYPTKKEQAKVLWERLGDIPVNEDDEIEESFLDFEVGTDKFEIWHWFEEKFDLSVAEDLMCLS